MLERFWREGVTWVREKWESEKLSEMFLHAWDSFVLSVEIPDAPAFTLDQTDRRSASFSWNKPYEGNRPVSAYTIKYFNVNTSSNVLSMTFSSAARSGTITNLLPFTVYNFSLTATNDRGESVAATLQTQTREDSEYCQQLQSCYSRVCVSCVKECQVNYSQIQLPTVQIAFLSAFFALLQLVSLFHQKKKKIASLQTYK